MRFVFLLALAGMICGCCTFKQTDTNGPTFLIIDGPTKFISTNFTSVSMMESAQKYIKLRKQPDRYNPIYDLSDDMDRALNHFQRTNINIESLGKGFENIFNSKTNTLFILNGVILAKNDYGRKVWIVSLMWEYYNAPYYHSQVTFPEMAKDTHFGISLIGHYRVYAIDYETGEILDCDTCG